MMSSIDACVYRDRKELGHGGSLLRSLRQMLEDVARIRAPLGRRQAAVDAVVASGELEAALADANDPLEAKVARATDALAAALIGQREDLTCCAEALAYARAPRSLAIRTAPGFSHFALHPQAYACATALVDSREALVVGVRAIGTTLSAVTAASLRARGVVVHRVTVAPCQDVSRSEISAAASLQLARARDVGATVLVVDEGNSLRDSTVATTAESILTAGVARDRIILLSSRPLAVSSASPSGFRTVVVPVSGFVPICASAWESHLDVAGGAWRSLHYTHEGQWPAVLEEFERRKLVAGGRLYKFEGLGSSGREARHRASALAAEGIALDPIDEGDGWLSYPWKGRPMHARELDTSLIEHMARYCARRPTLCPRGSAETDLEPLVALSIEQLLGAELTSSPRRTSLLAPGALKMERVATTDGRFQPHEWLRLDDGSVRKTDGLAHGDEHLLPGPTDIGWDLAGAIIEWEMNRDAREHFVSAYRRASGDDPRSRLDAWLVAYAAIRGSYSLFALARSSPAEAQRHLGELERYLAILRFHLGSAPAVSSRRRATSSLRRPRQGWARSPARQ